MVRAPCCESIGLKKGPWTAEEDQILVSYIQQYGHGNWRALPRHAGLLRCGKSCRLRWMNYLRPDIKRGNFTEEEENAIISLHGLLGNKWSAIAAKLPGRTDNEIKNVWHTHLKKRAKSNGAEREEPVKEAATPWRSCSELSSSTTTGSSTATRGASVNEGHTGSPPEPLGMDEDDWWSEALSLDSSVTSLEFSDSSSCLLPFDRTDVSSGDEDEDFWMRVLMEVGGLPELPNF